MTEKTKSARRGPESVAELSPDPTPAQLDAYLGEIRLFCHPVRRVPPIGWLDCFGQLVDIDDNQQLYSVIGTKYGGDGRTTFALPDLRSRVPVGAGTEPIFNTPYVFAQPGGQERVLLTADNLPAHKHMVQAIYGANSMVAGDGNYLGVTGSAIQNLASQSFAYAPPDTGDKVNLAPDSIVSFDYQPLAIDNRQPFIALRYCICAVGSVPYGAQGGQK
ncbi:MAG: phage tail protein [Alphaproteobacteria bacterium]|nr:MAG: phage tail protein [Alphaproteobacteria bacterium]